MNYGERDARIKNISKCVNVLQRLTFS